MKKIKMIFKNELFKIELLFIIGVIIIAITNFFMSVILGFYFLGITFISYSIFLFRTGRG